MTVLGLFAEGPNPAACLLVDGRVISFVEEERLCRQKLAVGLYPTEAVRFCLSSANLKTIDIDRIAFGWQARKYASSAAHTSTMKRFYDRLGKRYTKDEATLRSERRILDRFRPQRVTERIRAMLSVLGGHARQPPIDFVDHHLSHAASAFYTSGFDSSAIVTLDGAGEELCVGLWIGRGRTLRLLRHVALPDSLGWFYAAFTEYLGFRPYYDEGKVMALAGYGRHQDRFARLVRRVCAPSRQAHGYRVDPSYLFYGGHRWGLRFTDRLVNELGEPHRIGSTPSPDSADLAFAVQQRLEEVVLELVRRWLQGLPSRRLCLAGGVALNCRLNGELLQFLRDGQIDDIFIPPVSSDAGAALGSAMVVANAHADDPRFTMTHAYWGPSYSDSRMREALRSSEHLVAESSHPEDQAARLLHSGAVIGWFQGRSEVGARALGNRSILASPFTKAACDKVNSRVKHREPWRPFGASVLASESARYLESGRRFPFMIQCVKVLPRERQRLHAVVHIDGSTRPQTVTEQANGTFFSLLTSFGRLTGVPVLLNTSFNGPGEPIVCSPDDAVRCFMGSKMDALILGRYIVARPRWRLILSETLR